MMNRADDEKLWDLLGQAPPPAEASPFFARNVIRAIREETATSETGAPWFWLRRLLPAAAAVALLATGALTMWPTAPGPEIEEMPEIAAQLDEVDFAVVADLDDLLVLEEDGLWFDGDVSSL